MKTVRIIHTADWHADATTLNEFVASRDFLIAKVRELQPDILAMTGDVFHRQQAFNNKSAVSAVIETLEELASHCPVVVIKGNNEHDNEGSIEPLKHLSESIIALEHPASVVLTTDGHIAMLDQWVKDTAEVRLHIFSIPYPTKQWLAAKFNVPPDALAQIGSQYVERIVEAFAIEVGDSQAPRLVAIHANAIGSQLSNGQTLVSTDIMIDPRGIERASGADYVAYGHIHKRQQIAPKSFYSGNIFPIDWGESEQKSFNLVELGPHGTNGNVTLVDFPCLPLSKHEIQFHGDFFVTNEPKEEPDWKGAKLRVRVHVFEDEQTPREEIESRVKDSYPGAAEYKIEFVTEPVQRQRSSEFAAKKTLPEKMGEWAKVTNQPFDDQIAKAAAIVEREVEHKIKEEQP
jgi:DNA repair exonuclease SbcCD nuclease subunit